ncbi:MAG: DNA recombination protein RmuC [Alphaproteobacteria bacterium]|nr:DNA recombination protein RmuC [Alphaproteobacteria bacterium]
MLLDFSQLTAHITPEQIYAGAGFAGGVALCAFGYLLARGRWQARIIALDSQLRANREAWQQAGEVLDQRFKLTAQDALSRSHEQFLQLAQERLRNAQADGAHDMEKRQKAIADMIGPVQEHLKALSGAIEQVKGTDQALREDLKHLSRETARLVGALRDPSAQGAWGEFILEGVLEKSGLMKGVHYDTQVSMQTDGGRQRPDAVIHMQDGFNIIIDAKAPLNEFVQRLGETMSEQDNAVLMQNLARQVREHVKKLGARGYWENIESPDFTVLFLPSEHLYSMALRAEPDLVEFAARHDIIIASPTLLMSLLRVVGLSWRQVELAKNAQDISELGYDLYKRFLKYTEHFEKIGKGLQNAMSGYDAALGSLERQVLPAARKFRDLQAAKAGLTDVPALKCVETPPRPLALTEEDSKEKLRA